LATNVASSNPTGTSTNNDAARAQAQTTARLDNLPSLITVEVLGYGGGSGDNSNGDEKKNLDPAPPNG
jgi:hypothetical protein